VVMTVWVVCASTIGAELTYVRCKRMRG
jgi:hypothetical protein